MCIATKFQPFGGSNVMSKFFTDNDLDSLVFFQVPKVLVLGDRYKKMKPNALKLYMVLFDRMKLSMQNGWKDEQGRYYVRMSQEGASELFGWSPTTFRSMKKELENFGLLIQTREGQGKTNMLYILKCEYDEQDVYKVNKSVDTEMEQNEEVAQTIDTIKKNKSCSSRKTEVDLLEEQKLTTNKNNFNNNNLSNKFVNKEKTVNNENTNSIKIAQDEIIHKLSSEYMSKGMHKKVCLQVIEEAKQKKNVENFGAYLRTCFENTLYKIRLKNGQVDITQNASNSNILLYNIFEDGDSNLQE